MGDSDEEYEKRKSRDKFTRERHEMANSGPSIRYAWVLSEDKSQTK
jgi:hypothetical protein